MRRIALLVLTLAACVALPAAAHAGGTLTVNKNVAKAGTVTANDEIDCGLNCSNASHFFPNECDGEGICTPPDVAVSAVAEPGWSAALHGCQDGDGVEYCGFYMTKSHSVSAVFTDVADPTVAIGGPVAGSTVRGTIQLNATAADNHEVSRVEFYADGQKVGEDASAPFAAAVNTASLGDGTRTFSARSFDPSGRASAAATRTLTVDNTKPAVTITGGPDGLVSGDAAFTFGASDATSGIAQVQCGLDGGNLVPCDSFTSHAFSGIGEGPQTFLVRAVDGAGNTGDFASRSFTVDKTKPSLEITSGPADGALVGKPGSVTYAFTTSDANGIASVACAIDGAFGPCTGAGGHTAGPLADGAHSFSVRSVDAAGNVSTLTRGFTVDTTAPAVTFTAGPAEGAVIGSPAASFGFSITGATPGTGAIECELDGAVSGCDSVSGHDLEALGHGPHTFEVHATDQAGNKGTASRTFGVDLQAPETTIDTASTGAASAFTFSASEAGSTFRCRLYAVGATPPAFGDCAGASGSHSVSGLAAGAYVFEVVAIDAAGHADATPARREFTVTAKPNPDGDTGDKGTPGTPAGEVEEVDANAGWKWNNLNKRTRALRLNVRDIPQGATVEVLCDGRGCPFKRKALPYKAAKRKLAPLLKKRRLSAGTRVEVRVVKPNAIGWVIVFKMRPKGQPSYRVLCLPVGAARPAAC